MTTQQKLTALADNLERISNPFESKMLETDRRALLSAAAELRRLAAIESSVQAGERLTDAEIDALQEAYDCYGDCDAPRITDFARAVESEVLRRVQATPPQPSAPEGEREAFEAWYAPIFRSSEPANMVRLGNGEYRSTQDQIAWMAWQAAISYPSGGGVGVRLDGGALQMALNVLRRAGKHEVAGELEKSAVRETARQATRATQGAAEAAPPKFDTTACSQCGREFGPGNAGFSHCDQHQEKSLSDQYLAGEITWWEFVEKVEIAKRREDDLRPTAQPAASVPPGYKLVPVEPTTEMVRAGGREWRTAPASIGGNGAVQNIFSAMLAAAPSAASVPPAEVTESIKEII